MKFISAVNGLRIDVFCFICCLFINMDQYLFTIFISQLSIMCQKFVISDWVFSCIQYILLWLELRFCWRGVTVLLNPLSAGSVTLATNALAAIVGMLYSYFCLHCIVVTVASVPFTSQVSVSTFLTLLVFKGSDFSVICVLWREFDTLSASVCRCDLAVSPTQM